MAANSLHLQTEQRLQQRLAPMQVRFGRMLEMTAPEIDEEVRMALDEMPALELAEPDSSSGDAADGALGPDTESFNESAEQMQMADYRSDDDLPAYRLEAHNHSAEDRERWFDPASGAGETLIESLTDQLVDHQLSPQQRLIADQIIGNIDENGYLTRDIYQIQGDLALSDGIDASADDIRQVWDTVRSLDPAGVAAIDLRDCLLLQLDRRAQLAGPSAMAREIVAHYFDLLANRHFDRLASLLQTSRAELAQAVDVVASLNPKPGSAFAASWMGDKARHIIPDFSVEADEDILSVSLTHEVPELAIAETFAKDAPLPEASARDASVAMQFIRQRRDEATAFIKLLHMRQETLMRVMGAIARLQHDFFISGNDADIHPMVLRDVAQLTGYDLSTISRSTAGKYVATPHGIYPLKKLFNEATGADSDTSSSQLAARIRTIIEEEDKAHPLSDEHIAATLSDDGLDVARRTVAKYREKLGIPVARLRRTV